LAVETLLHNYVIGSNKPHLMNFISFFASQTSDIPRMLAWDSAGNCFLWLNVNRSLHVLLLRNNCRRNAEFSFIKHFWTSLNLKEKTNLQTDWQAKWVTDNSSSSSAYEIRSYLLHPLL